MYKIFLKNRFITLSKEPDRIQKYSLIHKFNEEDDLSLLVNDFLKDNDIKSINIYNNNVKHLWKIFRSLFLEVGAAGGLVKNKKGEFLVMRRKGILDLPKGHIEPGESIEECALREVGEECGIEGHKIVKKLPCTYHIHKEKVKDALKTTYWFLMKYSGQSKGNPQLEEDITEIFWMTPQEIEASKREAWPSLLKILNECHKY